MNKGKRYTQGVFFAILLLSELQHGLSLAQPSSLSPRQSQLNASQGYVRLPDQYYELPNIKLLRQDGRAIWLSQLMRQDKPVLVTFIYTSCSSICPIMTQAMLGVQKRLGERAKDIEMISITLDPEYDRPGILASYAKEIGAGPQWWHYTGRPDQIAKLAKSFRAYAINKMDHIPVFLLKLGHGSSWIRYQGFVGPADIANDIPLR